MKNTQEKNAKKVPNIRDMPKPSDIEEMDYYQSQNESQKEGEMENLPTNIKALKLLVKFEPPLIGLLYCDLDDNEKMHIYNVLLNGIINLGDPEEITKHLFLDHAMFFNEHTVNFKQVESLVAKILEYFIQLAQLDEEQLAQFYAMNKGGEEYMGDEEEDFQNISPVKINKQKNKNIKMDDEYEIDNMDMREYQKANNNNNKKQKLPKETHSD